MRHDVIVLTSEIDDDDDDDDTAFPNQGETLLHNNRRILHNFWNQRLN
jgi:hypothetical protein